MSLLNKEQSYIFTFQDFYISNLLADTCYNLNLIIPVTKPALSIIILALIRLMVIFNHQFVKYSRKHWLFKFCYQIEDIQTSDVSKISNLKSC